MRNEDRIAECNDRIRSTDNNIIGAMENSNIGNTIIQVISLYQTLVRNLIGEMERSSSRDESVNPTKVEEAVSRFRSEMRYAENDIIGLALTDNSLARGMQSDFNELQAMVKEMMESGSVDLSVVNVLMGVIGKQTYAVDNNLMNSPREKGAKNIGSDSDDAIRDGIGSLDEINKRKAPERNAYDEIDPLVL